MGVLHDACTTAGIPSASLWAAVPAYAQGAPSPKAALALVERVGDVLGLMVPKRPRDRGERVRGRGRRARDDDDDLTGYVGRLEYMVDNDEPFGDDDEDDEDLTADANVDEFVEELERYFRDQDGD